MNAIFFENLFYLGLIACLTFCYFLGCVFVYLLLRWLVRIWRLRSAGEFKKGNLPWLITRNGVRKISLIFLTYFCFLGTIYGQQRVKWLGSENAHHKAKEYFVAGQTLNFIRGLMTGALHPEAKILYPLHALQQHIYDRGSRYLPENDGEIGAWLNSWFIYQYTYKLRKPKGTDSYKLYPPMIALLDKVWFCLETQATLPMADKEMARIHFFRTYPVLANYYTSWKGHYNGNNFGSIRPISKDEHHTKRTKLLVLWLEQLKESWEEDPSTKQFIIKHPKISVLRQWVLISELMGVIQGAIWHGEFTCESPYVSLYRENRDWFVNKKEYSRTQPLSIGNDLFNAVVNDMRSRATKYILKEYCGVLVAGKEDNTYWDIRDKAVWGTPDMIAEKRAKSLYDQEIEILEKERGNGRN